MSLKRFNLKQGINLGIVRKELVKEVKVLRVIIDARLN